MNELHDEVTKVIQLLTESRAYFVNGDEKSAISLLGEAVFLVRQLIHNTEVVQEYCSINSIYRVGTIFLKNDVKESELYQLLAKDSRE
ncbi:hypothetical protein [Halalkalibacter urbisdiaboli]|uniref:hypothetical protein n=1 Tax=Halalkalibacter urbisdiaboli TaxID=1960589 RepID=UPI0010554D41|nr:hypothetical protein [Halalkalibacter urbisdiaboli]